jgi:hypothetical protein
MEKPQDPAHTGYFLQEFVLQENNSVRIGIYFRGYAVSPAAGEDFHKILAPPVHTLSKEEVEQVELILRRTSEIEYFESESISTQQINEMRLLVVEGRWKSSEKYDKGLFMDRSGDGRIVHEIHFLAPYIERDKYLHLFDSFLSGLIWNK